MKRRILYIAYFYPPVDGVGLPAYQRVKRFLKYLEGYESYVMTMKPDNYPDYYDKSNDIRLPIHKEQIVRTGTIELFRVLTNVKSMIKGLTNDIVSRKRPNAYLKMPDIDTLNSKKKIVQLKDVISILLTFPDFAHPWLLPAIIQGVKTVKKKQN
jgi:hypothetical protein